MIKPVNVHEAKTHFSALLRRVQAGEEIIIAKAGLPVARLVPVVAAKPARKLGSAKGLIKIHESFYAPMSADEIKLFEEGPIFPENTETK